MSEVWPRLTPTDSHQLTQLPLPIPISPPCRLPLAVEPLARFRLVTCHLETGATATATAPAMHPLLDLAAQLERLGYEFVRLERV